MNRKYALRTSLEWEAQHDYSKSKQTDWVICQPLATNLTQKYALVIEHLDAMCTVVADKDLFLIVHNHAIREFEVFATAEFLQNVAKLIENYHTHNLQINEALQFHKYNSE